MLTGLCLFACLFQQFKDMLHYFVGFIVSEKSTVTVMCCFLCLPSRFCLWFSAVRPKSAFLCIYPPWSSLNLLTLSVLRNLRNFLHCFFCCCFSSSFSHLSWDSNYMCARPFDIVPQIPKSLFIFLKFFLSLLQTG